MKRIMLFAIAIFSAGNMFSQSTADTLFLLNNKMVIGEIFKQYDGSAVKIITPRGKQYSYNKNRIKEISYGYRKDMEAVVRLRSGNELSGEIIQREYNTGIKIKTPDNEIIQIPDSEIVSLENKNYAQSGIYAVYLKNGDMIWGSLEEQKKDKAVIVKNIWINQKTWVERVKTNNITPVNVTAGTPVKTVYFKDGANMNGYPDSISTEYMLLRTLKYGDYLIKNDSIARLENYQEKKIEQQEIKEIKEAKKERPPVKENGPVESTLPENKSLIRIYNLNAVGSIGAISSNKFYEIAQLGINAQYISLNQFELSSEIRFGISTSFKLVNYSLNISPAVFAYHVLPEISVEAMPDIHIRFFKDGSKSTIGFIGGVKYIISPAYSLKLRAGYSSGFCFGIAGQYTITGY